MVNRRSGAPGQLQQIDFQGQAGSSAPDFAVEGGQAWSALAALGGTLSDRLRAMASDAAQRQGELAGLNAGAASGESFLEQRAAQNAATGSAAGIDPRLNDAINQAAAAHGVSADDLRRMATIESGGKTGARNPKSGALGAFQFVPSTAAQYGLTDPTDPVASADAAARLLVDNRDALARSLGRAPSSGELYLAHQQGAAGAAKLLANPNASAIDIVGRQAVLQNGGSADMTAAQFAGLWTSKFAGTSPALPVAKPDPNAPQIPSTPLALRNDGTIYGDAYDHAAIGAYSWRVTTGLTNDLGQAFEDNQNNPSGYAAAVAKIRDHYLKDENLSDPHLREAFDKSFDEQTAADRLKIMDNHGQQLRAEETQAVSDGVDADQKALERQAYNLGGNPAADTLLAGPSRRALARIDSAVTAGHITPAAGAKAKADLAATIARGRVQGTFDALPTPEAKESFATGLLADWSAGKGPLTGQSLDQVKAISQTLWAQARQETNERNAGDKAQAAHYLTLIGDDTASMAATGKGLPPDQLDPAQVAAVLPPAVVEKWRDDRDKAQLAWGATNGMEAQTSLELGERVWMMKPLPGDADFANRQAAYETAQKRMGEILAERQKDPLGQAQAGHLVALQPLDFSSADKLQAALSARRTQAKIVQQAYGLQEPVYLRPSEVTQLSQGLTDHPDLLPSFALSVEKTFGDDAPKILGQLSDLGSTAGALAQAAGITMATGDSSAAVDLARAIANSRDKSVKVKMPEDSKLGGVAAQSLGGALSPSDAQFNQVTSLANMLFQNMVVTQGFDPADVDKPGTTANQAYLSALDRALGKRTIGGVQYGGLVDVNGTPTVADSRRPADDVSRLLGQIQDQDLARLPPIGSQGSLKVSAGSVRGGHLVAIGDGKYRVAIGDPGSLNPQFLQGRDGGFWELDLDQLDAAIKARPVPVSPQSPKRAGMPTGDVTGGFM